MSTELQQQVSRIRADQIQSAPIHAGVASLFLDPKEAAGIDVKVVLDAALDGIQEIEQYDNRISKYRESLFQDSSIYVQRELKTSKENESINKEISSLLELLSLYASLPPTHRILEYLIRRYKVQELNATELIKCSISQHDSKIFARVVQLSTISGTVWSFLEQVKVSGSPIPRSLLSKQCSKNNAFLTMISQVVQSAVSLTGGVESYQKITLEGAERLISFYTVLVVEMIRSKPLQDVQLRTLYPSLISGLKAGKHGVIEVSWRRANSIVLIEISKKVQLNQDLILVLSNLIAKSFVFYAKSEEMSSADCIEFVTLLVLLAQHQRVRFTAATIDIILSCRNGDEGINSEITHF